MKYVANEVAEKNICICFDEKLSKQACVLVKSIVDTAVAGIYVIHCFLFGNIATDVLEFLNSVETNNNMVKVLFHQFDDAKLINAHEERGITKQTYMRLFLADILKDVDRILYLDVDIVVMKDLSSLWNVDMKDNVIMGVITEHNLEKIWQELCTREPWTSVSKTGKYINAGVLLMDAKGIRNQNLLKKWKALISYKYRFQDQDIINCTCQNRIGILPPVYNSGYAVRSDRINAMMQQENLWNYEEIKEAIENPIIVHYAGEKPWKNMNVLGGRYWWNVVLEDKRLSGWFKYHLLDSIDSSCQEYCKYENNYFWLNRLIQCSKNLAKGLARNNYYSVALYAWGYLGQRLYDYLIQQEVEVKYVIDKNVIEKKHLIPISSIGLNQDFPRVDVVIITNLEYMDTIKQELKKREVNCISITDLIEICKEK